jgi:OmpA-OmpF porin, OOP family
MKINTIFLSTFITGLTSLTVVPSVLASGFNFGADIGRTEAKKYCDHITNCSAADTGAKINVGYTFNEIFSTELGYTSFGTIFDSNDNSFAASQDASAITLSALGYLPINEMFSVYGRLGYARYNTNASGSVQGVAVRDQSGNTPLWGVGAKVDFSSQFSMRLEFQDYSNISRVDGQKDDVQGLFVGMVYSL